MRPSNLDPKSDPKFIRAFERGILRSAFVSLFWSIIQERKKSGTFTLQALAKSLSTNKAEVSRWFKGDPNWTVNTIAGIANALDVDIKIEAVDRSTKAVFTPAGLQESSATKTTMQQPVATASAGILDGPMRVTHMQGGALRDASTSISEAA
jgi:transcriptional regulator with XRE-family HTH domain